MKTSLDHLHSHEREQIVAIAALTDAYGRAGYCYADAAGEGIACSGR